MSNTMFSGIETGFFTSSDDQIVEYGCGADTASEPLQNFLDMVEPIKLMLKKPKGAGENIIITLFDFIVPLLARIDYVL